MRGLSHPENSNAFQYSSTNWLGVLYRFDTSVLYLLFSTICQDLDSDAQPFPTVCVPLLPPPQRGKRCFYSAKRAFIREASNYGWIGCDRIASAESSWPPFAATLAKDLR